MLALWRHAVRRPDAQPIFRPHAAMTKEPPAPRDQRPAAAENAHEDIRDAETAAGGNALGSTLKAITAAARIESIAVRGGIMADFARRMAAARMSADPQQLGGILRALKAERGAALAIASRNAKREGTEKRAAAIQSGSSRRPKKTGRSGRGKAPKHKR